MYPRTANPGNQSILYRIFILLLYNTKIRQMMIYLRFVIGFHIPQLLDND